MELFWPKTNALLMLLAIIVQASTAVTNVYEFNQKAAMVPHPDKAYRGGEDAFFSSNQLMIVADGVGSWADFGIDPAYYSRFLCQKGGQLFSQNKTFYRQNLIQLIANTTSLNEFVGSSTMAALTLSGTNLITSYIGDSGFLIFRLVNNSYNLHFEFKQQQHGFNFPFQLALKEFYGDDPYLAISQDFPIVEDDIVVVGSDGLFDNVFVTEIMNLINLNKESEEKLFAVPKMLAELAITRGKDWTFESPFSVRAKEQMLSYKGGKLDDTTVILAKIVKIKKTQPGLVSTETPAEKQTMKGTQAEQNKIEDTKEVNTYEVFESINNNTDWEVDMDEENTTAWEVDMYEENTTAWEEDMYEENGTAWEGENGNGTGEIEYFESQDYGEEEAQKGKAVTDQAPANDSAKVQQQTGSQGQEQKATEKANDSAKVQQHEISQEPKGQVATDKAATDKAPTDSANTQQQAGSQVSEPLQKKSNLQVNDEPHSSDKE